MHVVSEIQCDFHQKIDFGLRTQKTRFLAKTFFFVNLNFCSRGVGNWPEAEVIQQRVGKMLLGVSKMTAKEVVRGELGWMSLSARREIKVLKYWGRSQHGRL